MKDIKERIENAPSITIGGVNKFVLLDQVRATKCTIGPYVRSMLWEERFVVAARREKIWQINLSPADQGFSKALTRAEFFNRQRLAEWSCANLDGYMIALNPEEVGLHLAKRRVYKQDGEVIRIAMEPIPASDGRTGVFQISQGVSGDLFLKGYWMRPEYLIDPNVSFSFRLRPERV